MDIDVPCAPASSVIRCLVLSCQLNEASS